MASNQAAWLTARQANPLKVGPSDMPKAGADEVVLKNHAVAINPVDWKIQETGIFIDTYPAILGADVAGEVIEVGSDVKDFKVGDRVMAHTRNLGSMGDRKTTSAAFQLYTAAPARLTSKLPSKVSYTQGCVLPIALDTAIVGLYPSDIFALPLPSLSPAPSDKVIVVWGGSSSVGTNAIMFAKASGVTVITTASAHNQEFVKHHLKADHAFDHKSPDVVDNIVSAIKSSGKEFAGVYDAISLPASVKLIGQLFEKVGSGSKKLVLTLPLEDPPKDIEVHNVFALTAVNVHKDIAEHVWGKFLYDALEKGVIKPLPEPLVVGKGLESLQKALDRSKEGVSANKVVVEL